MRKCRRSVKSVNNILSPINTDLTSVFVVLRNAKKKPESDIEENTISFGEKGTQITIRNI
jgi:hypothetical protein